MDTDKISQKINALKYLYKYEIQMNDFYHSYTNVCKSNYRY